jgi:cell division protein FtsX
MQRISVLFFVCAYTIVILCNDTVPKKQENYIKEMEKECCNIVDAIFSHARASIEAKEDIMTAEWFSKHEEFKKLQNALSDTTIILEFDENTDNEVPERLQIYLDDKIRQEIPKLFEIYKISVKDVENFYELSRIICELSQGKHCARMIHHIEDENLPQILKLKIQKEARAYLRKQEARELRRALVYGTRRYNQ